MLFLSAAVRAAADEAGLRRRHFRTLVMRLHQYLDVHAVLAAEVHEPHHRVKRDGFEKLLRERHHHLCTCTALDPAIACGG